MRVKLEVRYADLDTLGHVNNAIYLTYFEQARVHLLEEYYKKVKGDFDFVIAHAQVDYLYPIFLEEIEVETWVSRIGKTSFTISYEIYNSKGILCARGHTVQVAYDAGKMTKKPIPDDLREFLLKHYRKEGE